MVHPNSYIFSFCFSYLLNFYKKIEQNEISKYLSEINAYIKKQCYKYFRQTIIITKKNNQPSSGQTVFNLNRMSFTIRPINAFIVKDTDTFTKMDPYVILHIDGKKYRTKTHRGGGKTPSWTDTFEVMSSGNSLMKVEVWDSDIIKDDFLGEGYYNLAQLRNFPGNVQNQYVDLIKHGKSFGRVLLSMKYNGSNLNQGYGQNQYQQGWGYQNQGMPQNVPYGGYNPNQNTGWNTQPNMNAPTGWGNNPNQNQGWGNMPYGQGNMPYGQGNMQYGQGNTPSCGTWNKNLGYNPNYPNYTK